MALSVLERAKRYFYRKKYAEVISTLEPHVLGYKDSFPFYLYLSLSYLHLGRIEAAVDYLACARQLNAHSPDLLATEAVLFLRQGKISRAVEYYLWALDEDPDYALAKEGLEFIRYNSTPEALGDFIESGKIKRLYPSLRDKQQFITSNLIALLIGIATFVVFFGSGLFIHKKLTTPKSTRADLSKIQLEGNEKKTAIDDTAENTEYYQFSKNQVINAYTDAQRYFQNHEDNLAQIEINRILNSNAVESIKQKSRVLMAYLDKPDFSTIKNSIVYNKAVENPYLYANCWTIWTGLAANIEKSKHASSFDLLVGYDTREVLDGVVPVICNFVVDIDPELPITVLGKIQIKNNILILSEASIYQSKLPRSSRFDEE